MSDSFEKKALGEIADLIMGQSPDSRFVDEGLDNGLPFLQGNAEFGDEYPSPKYSCSQPARTCESQDVLVSVRAPVGEINIADTSYCIGRGLSAVRFRSMPPTLGARLISKFSPALKQVAQGTTFEAIGKNELASLQVLVPPARERPLIDRILNTLDTQIRQTEALIAKLEQIKQGLLTDLLTRGIDEHGQLRPPPEQAPHLYKESPLGRIPREWSTSTISELLSTQEPAMRSGPFGSALLKSELVEAGIPLLGIDNVHVEQFRDVYTRFVTWDKFVQLERYAVRPGDLMITIMGTVGRCCLVPEDIGRALSSKHTWTITLDHTKYSPYLAMLQINFAPWVLQHLASDEQGGIMSAIRSETLRSVRLPVPPFPEQQLIREGLEGLQKRIEFERELVTQFYLEKSGLMNDLLTGRVRVTPLLERAEQATG